MERRLISLNSCESVAKRDLKFEISNYLKFQMFDTQSTSN
jgi:hypothetical protein